MQLLASETGARATLTLLEAWSFTFLTSAYRSLLDILLRLLLGAEKTSRGRLVYTHSRHLRQIHSQWRKQLPHANSTSRTESIRRLQLEHEEEDEWRAILAHTHFLVTSTRRVISSKGALRVATLNCRSLPLTCAEVAGRSMHRLDILLKWRTRMSIDILAFQEHRTFFEGESVRSILVHDAAIFFTSASKSPTGVVVGGVGLILPSHFASHVSLYRVNDRILRASFFEGEKAFAHEDIYSCYAPTASNRPNRKSFFSALQSDISSRTSAMSHQVLLGDFNTTLCANDSGPFGARETSLSEIRLEARTEMLHLLDSCKLVAVNTLLALPNAASHFSSNTKARPVTLDYILIRRRWEHTALFCEVSAAPFETDHRPIVAVLKYRLRLIQSKVPLKEAPLDYSKLLDNEMKEKLEKSLSKSLPPTVTISSWGRITKTINAVCAQTLPRRERFLQIDPEWRPATEELAQAAAALHNPYKPLPDVNGLLVKLSRAVREEREEIIQTICSDIETALLHDPARAYGLVRHITAKRHPTTLVSANSPLDRKRKIVNHVRATLNNTLGNTKPTFHPVAGISASAFNTSIFTLEELEDALVKLRNRKAPGKDEIPNEVLKCGALKQLLLSLFNQCLRSGTVPDQWKCTVFAMIPKSNTNLKDAAGWRYIALLNTASKLYDRLLLSRLQPIEPLLRPNQNGFRPDRSALHHSFALRALVDAATHQGMPLALCFLDANNAFPSISHASIRAALEAYAVPPLLINAVMSMYSGAKGCVDTKFDGITEEFPITSGVLQGDPLAPFLFDVVLDLVLRKNIDPLANHGVLIRRTTDIPRAVSRFPQQRLTDLDFADDVVLMSHDMDGLRILTEAFETGAREVGLTLNFKAGKTEWMSFNIPHKELFIGTNKVLKCSTYKYLGTHTDIDRAISMRIGMASTVCRELTNLWRPKLSTPVRIRLFRTIVEPCLIYGLQSLPLNPRNLCRIRGAYSRLLRRIHGPLVSYHMTLEQLYFHGQPIEVPQFTATILQQQLRIVESIMTGPKQPARDLLLWSAEAPSPPIKRGKTALCNTIMNNLGSTEEDHCGMVRTRLIQDLPPRSSISPKEASRNSIRWNNFVDGQALDHEEEILQKHILSRRRRKFHKTLNTTLAYHIFDSLPLDDLHELLLHWRAPGTSHTKMRFLRASKIMNLQYLESEYTFFYMPSQVVFAPRDRSITIDVYTDGAYHRKTNIAGCGIYVGPHDARNASFLLSSQQSFDCRQTNNRAELMAIIVALEQLRAHLKIFTDSQCSIQCVESLNSLCFRKMRRTPNRDLYVRLRKALHQRFKEGLTQQFIKIKGHAGHIGNECADRLAEGAVLGIDSATEINRIVTDPQRAHLRWPDGKPKKKRVQETTTLNEASQPNASLNVNVQSCTLCSSCGDPLPSGGLCKLCDAREITKNRRRTEAPLMCRPEMRTELLKISNKKVIKPKDVNYSANSSPCSLLNIRRLRPVRNASCALCTSCGGVLTSPALKCKLCD